MSTKLITIVCISMLASCAAPRDEIRRTDSQILILKSEAAAEMINVLFYLGQKRDTRQQHLTDHLRSKDIVGLCKGISALSPVNQSRADTEATQLILKRVELFERDLKRLQAGEDLMPYGKN